jgi:hypothetical protein
MTVVYFGAVEQATTVEIQAGKDRAAMDRGDTLGILRCAQNDGKD